MVYVCVCAGCTGYAIRDTLELQTFRSKTKQKKCKPREFPFNVLPAHSCVCVCVRVGKMSLDADVHLSHA